MGNQCCNSPQDSINHQNGKEITTNATSTKNGMSEKDKLKDDESQNLKEKFGKSIASHNTKDYQEGDDKLIGSQTNNIVFEEQSNIEKIVVEKNQMSFQLNSSSREIPHQQNDQKSIAKAGSGIKQQSPVASMGSGFKQIGTQENRHQPEILNGRSNSRDAKDPQGNSAPISKQSSDGQQKEDQGIKQEIPQAEKPSTSQIVSPQSNPSNQIPLHPPQVIKKLKDSSIKVEPNKKPEVKEEKKPIQNPPNNSKNTSHDPKISAGGLIRPKGGLITAQYKIGEILGEGAFGQVSKITHKTTGLVRAMKTIKKSSIIKEEEEKLFSEMNILKNLDHPNILRLIEFFQDNKNYYLVTEYCSGGELFDKIKSMTHFTEKMAADYMRQILSAVVYCHGENIVHRDLKPENLLFDSKKANANLKVIDFGTSRKMDKTKKMSKRLGTPYYIAPEVLEQSYDEKCDVWSCGVILFILLCGYPPFGGRSEDEILKKVKGGKFTFEPEDWDKISEDAKGLIKKMLTYDPKKRISAETALKDSWIQKNAPSNYISTKALSNLSSFYTRSKLKQAILTFIVSQVVSQQDKEELQKTFRSLDTNGDGTLSKEELVLGYTTVLGDRDQAIAQVDRIFDEVDFNKSGKVDFTEFLMAALNKETVLSKAKVVQSFKIFDQDQNGKITKDELQQIMGDISDDFWKQILEECDTDKDGMISQTEFIELLMANKLPV